MIIRINAWDKWKARKDVKRSYWFKCSNQLLEDPDLYDLTHEEMCCWIYIMSLASKKDCAEIVINLSHAKNVCRLSNKAMKSTIEKLSKIKMITIIRDGNVTDPIRERDDLVSPDKIRLEEIRREETRPQNRPSVTDCEFLYSLYPKKEGKSEGLKKIRAQIKTQSDYEDLVKAIKAYGAHVVKNSTEPRFIKHFSTFMTSWRDWLDPNHGTSTQPAKNEPITDWSFLK